MAIDYETLKNWSIPDAAQSYSERDTMLYALGLGVGADPTDAKQLAFVYEKGLKALPTLAMVIGSPGAWFTDPRIGINYTKLVNAGVSAAFHAPMPASGEVVGRSRVIALADKGVASGALLIFRRELHERQSGLHLCDIDTTYLCRGDGGFGGPNVDAPAPHQLPETKPELTVEFRTLAQLALIYRLSGDRNPLHADPAVAVAAGFPQPILHGLCTFGVVGYVALTALCDGDPARLKLLEARFSAPLFPGETLLVDFWRRGNEVSIRARSAERGVVVLNNGRAYIEA
jgi:acyl dehydratase